MKEGERDMEVLNRLDGACAAVVVLFLAACGAKPPEDPVILEIGGRPVTQSEFEGYVRGVAREEAPLAGSELKANLLQQFIDERLLLMAADAEGIRVDPGEVEALARSPEGPEPGEGSERDPADQRSLETHLRVRKLIDDVVLRGVRVDEEQVASYYEEHKAYYKQSEAVDVSQILVETEEEATRIRKELAASPARFEVLVGDHSVGPEASRGGHLGAFARGELPASLEEAVFALKKGQISPVVRTDFGYHIFRVNQIEPPRDLSLEDVADAIRVELLRKKSDEAMAAYLEQLKRRYPVKVFAEELAFPVNAPDNTTSTGQASGEGVLLSKSPTPASPREKD